VGPIEYNIPKVVKFTSQSMPSQNRVGNNLFQREEENVTQTTPGRNVCHNSSCLQVNACGKHKMIQKNYNCSS